MRARQSVTLTAILGGLLLSACAPSAGPDGTKDGGAEPKDAGPKEQYCSLTAPTECPTPAPVYADVKPIFERRCIWCHMDDQSGPWPLTDYSSVSDWRDDIRSDMLGCTMPPPDAGETMTVEERMAILTWIRCGLPR